MRRDRHPSSPKRILQQSIIAQEGVNLIERRLLKMGFLWYPTGGLEAGIDGHLEIRDSETGVVHNAIVLVQSKATTEPLGSPDAGSFEYICDERDINYWMAGNAPVILVRARPGNNEAYWVSIKDYFRDPERRRSRKVVFDKTRDAFDVGAKDDLRALAIPSNRGVYFGPIPIREQLLSNVLPVSAVAERIFVADTEFRVAKDMWYAAKAAGVEIGPEWVLANKRIISFHDLREPPWPQFCDRGTAEPFDASDWLTAEDRERQDAIAQLLYHCLTGKLTSDYPVRRDRGRECYYFIRTKDLRPRRFSYLSVKRFTKRTVFQAYPSRENPTMVAYYRHSAMQGHFRRYGDAWYLEIVPTYFFTTDGTTPHPTYEPKLKGIKAQELNNAVCNQVVMWAFMLRDRDPGLFRFEPYPFLHFGQLLEFEIGTGLDDARWLPYQADIGVSKADDTLELFDDED
jgi:uncharacterized protein DUF4365